MSWYKTGTITVNNGSAAITGSGTAWIANAAAGEAIYMPDGKFYEIASVNSDASITLASNYTGTSLAGQSYTILPSQSFIRDLAAQAAALINSYASIANAAGAGKFGDGTLGAPGISFVNDTNTGIRRTADGTFALVANGVDVATVGPSGMVLVTPNIGAATGTSLALSGALTAEGGTFTKTTAGDVARFTNAAASNKSLYIYTDATYAAIGSGTGAGGNNMAFNAVTNSISWATNSAVRMTLDASGNLGLGVTPPATYAGIKSFHVGGAGSSMMTSVDHAVTYFTNNLTLTDNWRYEIAGYAGSVYYQSAGAHVWLSKTGNLGAGNLPATSLTGMTLDASGNLGVGNSSGISRLQVYGSNSDNLPVANFRQDGASANIIEGAVAAGALRFVVAYTGNVTNTNNSYGAISDIKLKQDIVDAKSQWADVKALTVRKFRFKTDPTGFLMMGLIAQEAEAVSPGLVETTDDFEDVVIEPARTETKIVQRQKTRKVTVEQPTPTLVDGRYVLRLVATVIDAPLIEEHPLFAEDGSPIMEIVEPEQLAVTDEAGNVVTPAKPAVTRPAVHRVPVMEDVEETVEIPAKTERRPTGTQTKSVKYSILYMKAVKALQEAMERIETLEAEVAALKGV